MFEYKKLKKAISNEVVGFKSLAKKMNVPIYQNRLFSRFLSGLVNKNLLGVTKNKDYFVPQIESEITGLIRIHAKGFGFIDLDDKSVFVPAKSTNGAFDGDEVKVVIFRDPLYPKESQGSVSQVLKRNTTQLVGTVKRFESGLGLMPFNRQIKSTFRFQDEASVSENDVIKVQITRYGRPNIVRVTRLIGRDNDAFIDFKTAIEDANVSSTFSPAVLLEANQIDQDVHRKDLEGRIDFRKELIVTIDGDDTKDFDDAIAVTKLDNGNFKLFVHIADVTHYVREGSALSKEASSRGTSIYLPGKVIPMLPQALSNGICSLNPNVDRLTITAEMEINSEGKTINYKIYPSVINSSYRLTYKQVNNHFRGKGDFVDANLKVMLDNALALSQIIRDYKAKQGYIDFEIIESKIIVDATGKTTNIIAADRFESEMMIEDFMVRANETVAQFVTSQKLPYIYRVHDKPEIEKIQNMQGIISALGIDVKIPHNPLPNEFASVVNKIKQTRFDDFMKILMLRTMSKAVYSANNIGHFGLASKMYTHFTSPIRRYPDLMGHRMLREYFFNANQKLANHFRSILPKIALHSSEMEQKALELERRVCDIKKAEFYEDYIGQTFEGTIVSMLKFGFFVEFPNKAGGLVHVTSLGDKEFKLAKSGHTLSNGKRQFKIGDKIKVTIDSISKSEGKINLLVARDHFSSTASKSV